MVRVTPVRGPTAHANPDAEKGTWAGTRTALNVPWHRHAKGRPNPTCMRILRRDPRITFASCHYPVYWKRGSIQYKLPGAFIGCAEEAPTSPCLVEGRYEELCLLVDAHAHCTWNTAHWALLGAAHYQRTAAFAADEMPARPKHKRPLLLRMFYLCS